MFGKQAGLFCPSGTMSNQIALMIHLSPGEKQYAAANHIFITMKEEALVEMQVLQ